MEDYSCADPEHSYIDPKFIYDKTGYWKDELYRFGVVYILPNGQLTPVFNVRGGIRIGGTVNGTSTGFSHIEIKEKNKYGED